MRDKFRAWDKEKSCYCFYAADGPNKDEEIEEVALWHIGGMEIIGNIHENPELMEKST